MSERPLLLSSARSGVLVAPGPSVWWRRVAIVFGIIAIVGRRGRCGHTRLAHMSLGSDAAFTAFAPAAALEEPVRALDALTGHLAATSTTSFVPVRLRVPSIGVDAKVENVGKKADGSMAYALDFLHCGVVLGRAQAGAAGQCGYRRPCQQRTRALGRV